MINDTKERPSALVTGASSGIGAVFAERLEALAEQLRANHHANVEVMAADLSKSDDLRTVEKHISEHASLELLVNNAGFGAYRPFIQIDPDFAEDLINVQVIA